MRQIFEYKDLYLYSFVCDVSITFNSRSEFKKGTVAQELGPGNPDRTEINDI